MSMFEANLPSSNESISNNITPAEHNTVSAVD
jgi:hypothetical protein